VDYLSGDLPGTVEVCGEEVPIRCGWRRAVRSYSVPEPDGDGARKLLASWFSRDGRIPQAVLDHPAEALKAAIAWREEGMSSAMPYGPAGGRPKAEPSRTFDFEADSAIVCADFMRLYGIDLSTWQAHWWRFCALFAPLAATEGSLVAAAMAARSPIPAGLSKEERKHRQALRKAWALPVPQDELVRMENERIRREW